MSLTGRTGVLVPASSISDIPNSLLSKRQMKAMNSRNQIIELSASNGASQNDSGVISFNILLLIRRLMVKRLRVLILFVL
jgi:hypothetical protein